MLNIGPSVQRSRLPSSRFVTSVVPISHRRVGEKSMPSKAELRDEKAVAQRRGLAPPAFPAVSPGRLGAIRLAAERRRNRANEYD
jgi:hypothetical protein